MEPALTIFVCVHRVRLIHFICVIWEFCAHVEHAYLRELTYFILKHGIPPIKIIKVKDALFLNNKLIIVFYSPHSERIDVHQLQLIRWFSLHLLQFLFRLFNNVTESVVLLVKWNDKLTVLLPLFLELVVNPNEGETAISRSKAINDVINLINFFIFDLIESQNSRNITYA